MGKPAVLIQETRHESFLPSKAETCRQGKGIRGSAWEMEAIPGYSRTMKDT